MKKFIEPYNPNWKTEFENIRQVIETELSDLNRVIDIQHIGSTSIPGLFAKPVLDIDIIIDDKDLLQSIASNLKRIGYKYKAEQGIPGRFAFRQTSDLTPLTVTNKKWPSHHLYVCYSDSLALKNHLLFRDALLNDKSLVKDYSQLKINLTRKKGMTRENYTRQKTDFIISVLRAIGLDEKDIDEITKANI